MIVPCTRDPVAGLGLKDPFYLARCRFYEALKKWPRPGMGVHGYIMRLANLARHAGLSQEEAIAQISAAMPRAASPSTEVEDAVHKAYRGGEWQAGTGEKKIMLLPETQRALITRGKEASEAAWRKKSPVLIPSEPSAKDAVVALDALWQPDEVLFLGDTHDKNVATVREWRAKIEAGHPVPPHVIPNPVKPEGGMTLEGKPSSRCDDAVASFRFAVAEFDGLSKADQLRLWWGFESAPIVALIDSAGKSIHAWLRVDCPDRAAWERDVEQPCNQEERLPHLATTNQFDLVAAFECAVHDRVKPWRLAAEKLGHIFENELWFLFLRGVPDLLGFQQHVLHGPIHRAPPLGSRYRSLCQAFLSAR